jgi:hypothetical protein
VHLTDLMPTFMAAADARVDPAWHMDGIILLPVWTGHAIALDPTMFWEWLNEGRSQLDAAEPDEAGHGRRRQALTSRRGD